MTTSAIDQLVNRAMEGAKATPAPATSLTVVGETAGVPTTYQAAALPTLAEIAQTARVKSDFYLQVMKDGSGLKIGKEMQLPVDEFKGTLDVPNIKQVFVIRVDNGGGQQAKYVKSANMVTSLAGVQLDRAIKQVLLPGGTVKDPYLSFMVPVILTEDVADPKTSSKFVAEKGKTVMVETSYSASMDFEGFVAKLARIGFLDANVPVIVKGKKLRSGGGIEYGSVEFDIDAEAMAANLAA